MTGVMEKKGSGQPRIGIVDNWHPSWSRVQQRVGEASYGTRSLLQPDGWLSARENLLVAFVDDEVAGHLCFRVEPDPSQVDRQGEGKRHCVTAEVDSFAIDPAYANLGIAHVLRDAAQARARELRCGELRGFELVV